MANVTMIPVAMVCPNREKIHARNPYEQPIDVPEPIIRMADSHSMLVSFELDGVSDPRYRQAYFLVEPGQKFWGGWYVIGEWECLDAECQTRGVQNG